MKIKVLENRNLVISNLYNTENENRYTNIEFIFPEVLDSYNKKIVFILPAQTNNIVWDLINNDNTYVIKNNITQYKSVQFYIWVTHENIDFRSKTYKLEFFDNVNASGEITPEEIGAVNQILAELDAALVETNNLNIDVNKIEHTATVTITKKNGTSKSVNILDGDKGETGETGNGISNIEKESISGLVDTYRINYTNGQHTNFNVTNGYTPVRGTDYWTQQDIAAIDGDIDTKLSNYFNKPFISFNIDENGNLIAEVEEYVNND